MVTTVRIGREGSLRPVVVVGLVISLLTAGCADGASEGNPSERAAAPVELETDSQVDGEGVDGLETMVGDWRPSCTDPVADQSAWNRRWAQDPVFEAGQERDYHEHPEFDSILLEATAPLRQCTTEHVQRVRALVEPTSRQAPETHARILAVFDDLIASIPRDTTSSTETAGGAASPAEVTDVDGCRPPCAITGSVNIVHPSWGALAIVVFGPESGRATTTAGIVAVDAGGSVRWRYDVSGSFPTYRFRPAGEGPYYIDTTVGVDRPVDALGRIFIDYDPGRYNGVIILEPTKSGFEDFATLPPSDNYAGRFYYAEATDADGDGRYEIRQYSESGVSVLLRWDGTDYRRDADSARTSTTSATTTTTAQTTGSAPATSSDSGRDNVSELFVQYWVAGNWPAMAAIADPAAVTVAQEFFQAGGVGAGCSQSEIDGGGCEVLYAPGPTGMGLIFQAVFNGTGSSARLVSLTFAGDAG